MRFQASRTRLKRSDKKSEKNITEEETKDNTVAQLLDVVISKENSQGSQPSIEIIIDSILQNAAELKEFVIDNHPCLKSMSQNDPNREKLMVLLCEALALNIHYRKVSCKNVGLNDVFINAFCSWLNDGCFGNLESLEVEGNSFSRDGIVRLLTAVVGGKNSIKKLSISSQVQENLPLEVQQEIGWMFRSNEIITRFAAPIIDDSETRTLIRDCLQRNIDRNAGKRNDKPLTEVEKSIRKICQNADIDEFVLEGDFVFKNLPACDRLGLAKAFRINSSVRTLRLVNCDIDDDFVLALSESLIDNNCIKFIDLSGNRISHVGLEGLMQGLALNRSVQHCIITDQNPALNLDSASEQKLVETVRENSTLVKFDIGLQSQVALDMVDAMIQRNCLAIFNMWHFQL